MKWFLVIFFMQDYGSYVFYKPEFDSLDACVASANNPQHIATYGQALIKEYGFPVPIQQVICADEDLVKRFINLRGNEIGV